MWSKMVSASVASVALVALFAGTPAVAAKADYSRENLKQPNCDRRCLLQQLNRVLDALTENTPNAVTLAPQAKITANGEQGPLTASAVWGPGRRIPYREAFVDPTTGSAAFFGVVTNSLKLPPGMPEGTPAPATNGAGKSWWYYALRIKVVNKQITEVEQIDFDPGSSLFGTMGAGNMHLADRIWDTVLPESERVSREQLMVLADQYFDVVSKRVKTEDVPWHPECQRLELGMFTTNSDFLSASCGNAMKLPMMKWNVENRRFYIADVERGIVFAVGNFMAPSDFPPTHNSAVVFEVFKVQDGLLRYIEAFFRGNKQLKSGWGEGPGS